MIRGKGYTACSMWSIVLGHLSPIQSYEHHPNLLCLGFLRVPPSCKRVDLKDYQPPAATAAGCIGCMYMAITAHAKPQEDATPCEPTHSVVGLCFQEHLLPSQGCDGQHSSPSPPEFPFSPHFYSFLAPLKPLLLSAPAKTLCLTDTWCEPRAVFV